jgi:DNA-directed RNA polymerase subunit RPC12/RpoP
MYSAFECRTCRKEFVLLSVDVEQLEPGRYIVCPYCTSKHVKKQRVEDSLKDCMKERSYKKVHGAVRQVGYE